MSDDPRPLPDLERRLLLGAMARWRDDATEKGRTATSARLNGWMVELAEEHDAERAAQADVDAEFDRIVMPGIVSLGAFLVGDDDDAG